MRLRVSKVTDRRLNFVHTLILGIQIIKSQVWEENIVGRIKETRKLECSQYFKMYFIKWYGDGFFRTAKLLLSIPIILIPLSQGNILQAAIIFPAITMADFIA